MMGTMYEGSGRLRTAAVDVGPPGPGELQIAVAYCGLCGTDLHIVHGDMDARVRTPLVFGHEASGTVAAVGAGVQGWTAGDPLTVMPLIWDGTCSACLAGHQHICQNLVFVGIDSPGALQQRWNVPASIAVPLPGDLDLRTAALVEPAAVAVHDVRRSGLHVGDHAVVLGGGPIGLLIACVAREAGAHVMVAEIDGSRRALVAALGFEVRDPAATDLTAEVTSWTGGVGADVVFEVSGAAAAARATTALARVRGTIVVVAIHTAAREIDLQRVFWRELRLLGARVYQRSDFERAIELLRRGVVPAPTLISGVVPLSETATAVEDLSAGRAMKILVDVAGEVRA
ncbi:zinc-dependent alcohol dehydrogenase [Actinoplanes xinjiangensis]|uniref:2-desacetyl-2-hydroxyethyl bacteriochlorophyllide A dehydrogenase n=1 Tax=Actinoplanes xinjiangensis TaxID=512350 RepID=A0A316F9Q7_9ACTN|nr:alcohol dehydrogenase catalytic domain-containing protein [Actinoplanes xinjiangensis]PWK43518.1 2-desacetyl-2-hydroxyethyl bacteriochlorophyllide A dehydrogenase [Actinoplanes xinjiangensis]GIF41835.1 Zn-dependent alcohol dehydrogenase [Actinoplanes xinjiangensis]